MPVLSYQRAVGLLQPIIVPVFDALQYGLDEASAEHVRRGFLRKSDRHYFLHSARRSAFERLSGLGLVVTVDDGDRSLLSLSGLLINHRNLAIRMLRPETDAAGREQVPLAPTQAKQDFYAQRALPGMDETANLLLVWSDTDGRLNDSMKLVHPIGGDNRRDNLQLAWEGPLRRDMAALRARDLDELQPERDYGLLSG
jgi:hypothetical protein